MSRLLVILLAAALHAGTAWAGEQPTTAPPPAPARATGPSGPSPELSGLSEEDQEVVANLELLESLETAEDLELLLELSKLED